MTFRSLAAAASFGLLAATLTACGAGGGGDSAEKLTIGAIRPQTGALAQYGARYQSGVELAVETINADGGIDVDGDRVDVDVAFCDSEADAAQAAACGRKLSSEQRAPVVTTSMSLETFPNMAINAEGRSPFVIIAGSASNKLVTEGNPLVARYWFNTYTYMPAFTKLLDELLDGEGVTSRKVAVLYSEDETGKSWHDTFSPAWKEAGGTETGSATFKQGDADFYPQLTKLIKADPEVIALPAGCTAVTPAVEQARELGYEGRFLFAASCTPGEMVAAVGADAIAGSIFEGTAWDGGSDAVEDFKKRFAAANDGTEPTLVEGVAYAHAMWAFRAAAEAGTLTDAEAIRSAMPDTLADDSNFLGLQDMTKDGEASAPVHPRLFRSADDVVDFFGS